MKLLTNRKHQGGSGNHVKPVKEEPMNTLKHSVHFLPLLLALCLQPAGAATPPGYPVVDEESISLLQLSKTQDNLIAGFDLFNLSDSTVAFSQDHEVFLHAWVANHDALSDGDEGLEHSIFVQAFNLDGESITEPMPVLTIEINSHKSGDDSALPAAPDEHFLYSVINKTLGVVYDTSNSAFLVTWTNQRSNTATPAFPEPGDLEIESDAVYGVTVTADGADGWDISAMESIPVTTAGLDSKVFPRSDGEGFHRFAALPNGNIQVDSIRYTSFGASLGFSVESSFELSINDDMPAFASALANPSPYGTLDYAVTHDPIHDRYTVAAIHAERFRTLPSVDTGEVDYYFYTAVVSRSVDAARIENPLEGAISEFRVIESHTNKEYLKTKTDSLPARLHFETVGASWKPLPTGTSQVDILWTGRAISGQDGEATVADAQNLFVRRFNVVDGGSLGADTGLKQLPGEKLASPLMYTPASVRDEATQVDTVLWGGSFSGSAIALQPGSIDTDTLVENTIKPGIDSTYLSNTYNRVTPRFITTSDGVFAHFPGPYGSALQKIQWAWTDLEITATPTGTDNVKEGTSYTVEVRIDRADIADLPVAIDKIPFIIRFADETSTSYSGVDDETLEGDAFAGLVHAQGIAAGDSYVANITLKNMRCYPIDSGIALPVQVLPIGAHDVAWDNSYDRYDVHHGAEECEDASGDGTGAGDTGSGGDGSSGEGSSGGDSNGDASDDGDDGSSGGSGGGGGATFWLLGLLALSRLRR